MTGIIWARTGLSDGSCEQENERLDFVEIGKPVDQLQNSFLTSLLGRLYSRELFCELILILSYCENK
jgi:hypothetical protein